MNLLNVGQSILYWSEVRKKLLKTFDNYKSGIPISLNDTERIKKMVIAFCKQGTGFQRTIYKFVDCQLAFFLEERKNKYQYDNFVKKIIYICGVIDIYLGKHPRHKKTISSIKDLSLMHWRIAND